MRPLVILGRIEGGFGADLAKDEEGVRRWTGRGSRRRRHRRRALLQVQGCKLLPLHLPPRVQMDEEAAARRTPREHRPSDAVRAIPWRVTGELTFCQWGAQRGGVLPGVHGRHGSGRQRRSGGREKKSWFRKLRFVRQLNLG